MKIPFLLFGIPFLLSGIAAICYLLAKQPPGFFKLIFNRWRIDENINRFFVLIYGIGMIMLGFTFTVFGVLEILR